MAICTVAGVSGNVKQEKIKRFTWDTATALDKTDKFKDDSFPQQLCSES